MLNSFIVPPAGQPNERLRLSSIQNVGFIPGKICSDKRDDFCKLQGATDVVFKIQL